MQTQRIEKYVRYLIADITAATKNVPVFTIEEPDEELPFMTMEEEEKNARREPLGEWMGIKQEWFPPFERLSEQQIGRIMNAMNRCLHAYGFLPHFPSGLPLYKQYQVLIDHLSQPVPILVFNSYQIDFCSYEPKSCPFGDQFCQCKVYERWISRFEEEDEFIEDLVEEPESSYFPYEEEEDNFFIDEVPDGERHSYESDDWEDDMDSDFLSGFFDFDIDPDDDGRLN
jgi:hypothetical protein